MTRYVIVLLVVSVLAIGGWAQNSPQHHHSNATVDGSKNPELIPDAEAQLHWLLVTASFPENLTPLGLSDIDKLAAVSVITDFKSQFLQMIDTYNKQATEAEQRGSFGDVASFQSQIDAFVARTFQKLETRLSPGSFTRINKVALAMKSNIQRGQQ